MITPLGNLVWYRVHSGRELVRAEETRSRVACERVMSLWSFFGRIDSQSNFLVRIISRLRWAFLWTDKQPMPARRKVVTGCRLFGATTYLP